MMKLTNQQIRSILTGAVQVQEKEGALCPYRFTEEQMELYDHRPRYGKRQLNGAGIRLAFQTDSSRFILKVNVTPTSAFQAFSLDLLIDGTLRDCLKNFEEEKLSENYLREDYPTGVFSKEFSLGAGEKAVEVYFPHACVIEILEVSLEEGATFAPLKREKKLLAFGDSITQGYNVLHPSRRYTAQIADLLGAEEINKGVGGETFFPELAEAREDFDPDYILIAYGTNDWGKSAAPTELPANCKRFYETVSRLYPRAQIFGITPIWRADFETLQPPFGPFEKVRDLIRSVAEPLPNVKVIDGFPLVPGDPCYFSDEKIHPNDEGFTLYAKNLYKEIKK